MLLWGMSCPLLSTVLQCGAWLLIHTLNYWTMLSAVPVFGSVLECEIAHCRCVAVIYIKIRCDPMHSGYDGLPVLYVPMWITCALASHCYTYAPPHFTVPQNSYSPSRCLCWMILILMTLYSMGWYSWVLRAGPIFFYQPKLLTHFVFYNIPYLFFLSVRWFYEAGVFGMMCKLLSFW